MKRVVLIVGSDGIEAVYGNDTEVELYVIDASLADEEPGNVWLANVFGQPLTPGSYTDFTQVAADFDPEVVSLMDSILSE